MQSTDIHVIIWDLHNYYNDREIVSSCNQAITKQCICNGIAANVDQQCAFTCIECNTRQFTV